MLTCDWGEQAACRHADPDLFFPIGTTGPALLQAEEAKRICRACPVQAACLTWAIDEGIGSGIWGGTTEEERHTLRRTMNRGTQPRNLSDACGPPAARP
jgi:WhiB family transcriptional regulator, redox-sensing transcriptional regulator